MKSSNKRLLPRMVQVHHTRVVLRLQSVLHVKRYYLPVPYALNYFRVLPSWSWVNMWIAAWIASLTRQSLKLRQWAALFVASSSRSNKMIYWTSTSMTVYPVAKFASLFANKRQWTPKPPEQRKSGVASVTIFDGFVFTVFSLIIIVERGKFVSQFYNSSTLNPIYNHKQEWCKRDDLYQVLFI